MLQLEIWDTAGQERFHKSLISTYYRNVDAVIFVYDVTNQQSFDDLKIWIEESIKNGLTCIPRILIGNKCDQPAVVNRNVAQCFADANGMLVSICINETPVYVKNESMKTECTEDSTLECFFHNYAIVENSKKSLI